MPGIGDIFGRYTITETLGQGGMGTVYRAHDPENDRDIALKVLNPDLEGSDEYRELLANEAKVSAGVDSPYIVKVYDQGEVDGTPYIALELVPGPTLDEAAESLDFDERVDLMIGVGNGIRAAHDVGLIHRDLKPENIKLAEDKTPRILDFGLARQFDPEAIDEFGNIEGTLYYVSPEQLSGEPPSPSADIFSYGTIFYELLTGRRPFEGAYTASLIYAILQEEPPSPTEVDSSLPAWTDNVLLKLLAKSPTARFASIGDALEMIENSRTTGTAIGPKVQKRRTVTVVDIQNRSKNEEFDYFCEGFTEDVIHELSRRTDLIVSAEPATSYRRDIGELFEKLRSDYVITGSLMMWQDQFKLNLSIFAADGNEQIWTERFTDHIDNLFDLLNRAAGDASAKLAEVTDSSTVEVTDEFQPNVTAYDYYLRGKSYYQTNKPEDLKFAEDMYRRALEIEPNFALAHAGMSHLHAFMYMAFYDRSHERIENAKASADRAIECDPKSPEAHRAVARYHMFSGDLAKAERELLKVVELDPKYAIGHRTLAWLKRAQLKFDEAIVWARKALDLAPTDLETLLILGLLLMDTRKFTPAMATLQRAIELAPDYGRAYYILGQAYLKLGSVDLALENFLEAGRYKGDPNAEIDAGYTLLIKRSYDDAIKYFKLSLEEEFFPFVAEYFLGLAEQMRGNTDAAQQHFEKSIALCREHDLSPEENVHIVAYYALVLAAAGRHDEARQALKDVDHHDNLNGEILYTIARAYAQLDDVDMTMTALEQAREAMSGPTQKEIDLDPHFAKMLSTSKAG